MYLTLTSPQVRLLKEDLDSGFHAADSGFQSLSGFRIPQAKFCRISKSGFYLLWGEKQKSAESVMNILNLY